ncbi:MAG: putative Ig domain-containing protein, partial [Ignavibacteriales bacterium]
MESAKYTGNDIWKYGTGRVDVNKAVSQNTVVTPASISLGMDDVSQQIWIKMDTISIYNYSAESELFTLNVESSLPPGIEVTFDKTSLEVAAYRSEKIIATFRIDNSIVPYLQTNPPSYSGSISIKSQKHSLLVPFAFIKGTMLKMDFDEELWFVSICPHDKNLAAVRYLNPGKYLYLPLPKGLYTVLCVYYDAATYVIKENILIEEITSLSISRNDAKNEISFSMKNNSGQLIKDAVLANLFTHSPSGYWVSVMGSVPDKFRISDASSNILLEWVGSSTNDARNYFRTNGFTRGISKNLTFTNDPGSYRHYLAKYNTPSSIKTLSPYEGLIINYQNSKVEFFYGHNGTLLQSPFIQNIHLSPAPYKNFGFSYRKRISELNNDTPNFELNAPDTLWGYFQKEDKTPCFTTLKTDLLFNSGPPQLLSNFKNTSQNIVLKSPNISGLFFNQMKDFNYSQLDSLQYKLYTGIKFLSSGRLKDQAGATNKLEFLIPAVGQPYRLQLYGNPGCYINGRYVKATMETEFDTRKADKNPPCMKSFNIISNGLITCIPDSASGGKILFEIDDNNGTIGESGIKDVTLEYRTEAASDWLRMNLDRDNTTYTSNIPPTFDKGYVSLRFVAKDNSDNILTYTVEPAFKFGTNHLPVIHNNSEITAKVDSLLLFQVNAEDDDGDNLKYSLDVKPAWMKIDSSSGMIMGIPRAGDAGDTIAVVRVNDKNKSGVSRNFIVHVINTNHPPSAFTLMAPGDKDTLSLRNPSVPVNFRWSSSKDPDYNDSLLYSFNISGPGLDTLISKLRDTTLTVNLSGLLPKSVYTWDVTVSDGRLLTKSGRQFTFRTSDNTSDVNNMASLLPVEFELDQNYPNPFNPATTVNYSLPRSCHVIIKLFDFLGREVATLVDQVKNAGYYKTVINGDELTSGVYLYKMTAGEFMMTKKMILLK